jgi:hypothetical protein
MSLSNGDESVSDATWIQADRARPGTAPGTCSVDLPDGSPCSAPLAVGSYCEHHSAVADRDLKIFEIVHGHFEQDLREFWQRSNFYLVVDGLLLSAFVSAHLHPLQILLACAGLVISLFWLLVARGSITWIRLWRGEVRRLDQVVNRFHSFSTVESRVQIKKWSSPSWLTQWLPAFFLVGWIVILLLAILRIASI